MCFISVLTACTSGTSNKISVADSLYKDSLDAVRKMQIHDSIMRVERKYINSVKGHKEEDVIIGKFVDDNIDTLWFERPANWDFYKNNTDEWVLCCSNKKVKKCKIEGVSPKLVFEGDLDGNGTDDFGFLDTWYTSACRNYYVLTIKNRSFMCMLAFETALNLRTSGKNLVEKSNTEGYAHVFCSDMEASPSSCSWAPIADTLIKFKYQKFD